MRRHGLLGHLHRMLRPRTYLEIGVRNGASLARSRARSIGVDPFFAVDKELRCDLHLVRATSDELFAREQPLAHFDEPLVDLAFIDGMHLSEYALRDFVNTERYCHAGSVVVIDDMLPRAPVEAVRDRARGNARGAWTGDVYKVAETLRALRPDLLVLELDTEPTGTVVVLGADPASRVLLDAYDDLVEAYVTPDPQQVPDAVLRRSRAHDPRELLAQPLWSGLVGLRDLDEPVARARLADLTAGLRR